MFVLESRKKNRKAKREAWERAGRAWVAEKNSKLSYSMYDMSDYARKHPYHGINLSWLGEIAPWAAGLLVVTLFTGAIFFIPEPTPDPNNPNNCSTVVKKGDKVAIKGGDFEGSKGEVIEQRENCDTSLTITSSAWTPARCMGVKGYHCDRAKENGEILTVDDSGDIIKL